jgi:site-specific recombinase XerD
MNPAELAQTLELMAQALRLMAAAPGGAQSLPVAAPAQPQRTVAAWLDVHEQQLRERGYKEQTIRNRTANLRHVRRLWGQRPIEALRAHEIISAIRAEFLPAKTSMAQRVLAELRDAYNEAIAADWAGSNPASHVKLPSHHVMRKRLSLEVWQRMRTLAQASRQRWLESLLLLALVTGQRRADLA